MSFDLLLQYFFSGLTYGSIYAIIAIGFNIIYNSTGIINFAQGEFAMLGSMIAYSLASHMALIFAVIIAVLATACIGSLIELIFIRSLIKSNLTQINIITAGSIILIVSILFHKSGNSSYVFFTVLVLSVVVALVLINGLWFFSKTFRKMFQEMKKPNVLQMIVITIGLSIIIREIALQIWGESVRTVPYFTGNEVSSVSFLGVSFFTSNFMGDRYYDINRYIFDFVF